MMLQAGIVSLFFTTCLCQLMMDMGMRPDVTFGEQNDRFDVGSIIDDQNRVFDDARDADDYRRHRDNYKRENENNARENEGEHVNDLLNAIRDTVASLNVKDFDHVKESSAAYGNVGGKRRSLLEIVNKLHGGQKFGRRSLPPDPETEILFHYGVPVNMKLEGYLQVPLEKR